MAKKEINLTEKPKIQFEDKLIEKAKKISVKEASAYSFMDGFGLRYITPYALAVGATNNHIGLLNSIPSLFGNLSQLLTLKAMDKWSRKKIVFTGVFLQAIMWLFLIAAGSLYFIFNIKNELAPYAIVIIYTILIFVGSFAGPAWTSWMKDLVKKNSGDYFGKRARRAGIIAMICMLVAGFILDYFKGTKIFIGFAIIFSIAFFGRLISSMFTLKEYEPKFEADNKAYFTIFQFIKKMAFNNFGRFVIYFSLVSLAVTISSPFFAVYMLKNLNFSYVSYIIVSLSSSITTLVFMPLWGKFADKYGNLKVMNITGMFVPIIPILWMFSAVVFKFQPNLILLYLVIIEGASGIAWAGFNLSAGNFIYDAVTRQRIAICASYFSIINGFGVVIGATLGGLISSINFTFLGLSSLFTIFLLSAIARFIVYITMNKRIKEVRKVQHFDFSIKKETSKILESISMKKFVESLDSRYDEPKTKLG